MTEQKQAWRRTLSYMWFFRGPLITLPIAALLCVVFWIRGSWIGVISSLAWFVMSVLVMISWKLKADQTRQLLERHRVTEEDLSPREYRSATSEVIEEVQQHDQVVFVSLPRSLQADNAEQHYQRWQQMWDEGKRHFFLDGGSCEQLSSEGIQVLTRLWQQTQEADGSFFLIHIPLERRLHLQLFFPALHLSSDPESAMWIVWSKLSSSSPKAQKHEMIHKV